MVSRNAKFLPQMGMLKFLAVMSVLKTEPQYLECKAEVDEQADEPKMLFLKTYQRSVLTNAGVHFSKNVLLIFT